MRMNESEGNTKTVELSSLDRDCLSHVSSFLDVRSRVQLGTTSKYFLCETSCNEAGWTEDCERLWSTKVHVCKKAREIFLQDKDPKDVCARKNAREAYKVALLDATQRQEITTEELCYNPQRREGIVWSFRFKESAGSDWTFEDPWWNFGNARQLVFLEDGTVMELVQCLSVYTKGQQQNDGKIQGEQQQQQQQEEEEDDEVEVAAARGDSTDGDFSSSQKRQGDMDESNENNGNTPKLQPRNRFFMAYVTANSTRRSQQVQALTTKFRGYTFSNPNFQQDRGHALVLLSSPRGVEMKWRFVCQTEDLPSRPQGGYIRISVGGRDVPTFVVRRSPTKNWGFIMESCWGLFASFDLPLRRKERKKRRREEEEDEEDASVSDQDVGMNTDEEGEQGSSWGQYVDIAGEPPPPAPRTRRRVRTATHQINSVGGSASERVEHVGGETAILDEYDLLDDDALTVTPSEQCGEVFFYNCHFQ